MKLLFTKEETQEFSLEEINAKLNEAFIYDDFAWQKKKRVPVRSRKRAEGLHKVLYQCPACRTEYQMASAGNSLRCGGCGKEWEMDALGGLRALSGETEFAHIPDWYEWERANVRREVAEGVYAFEAEVRIESLPNAKGFVRFPEPGRLIHNMDGFLLSGAYEQAPFTLRWAAASLYSCHIEYDYMGRGDCVDLNTGDDTLYLFPANGDWAVTKIALATEELYQHWNAR